MHFLNQAARGIRWRCHRYSLGIAFVPAWPQAFVRILYRMAVFMSIPNILSLFRLALVPAFVASFFLLPPGQRYWLAVILLVSGLSDVLDGYIARKFHQITSLGKILDPAADKITVAAVLFCLTFPYPQICPVLIVYIVKELLMLSGGVFLSRRGVKPVSSRWFGKLATFMVYTVMFLFIIIPHVRDIWLIICNILVVAVTLFALIMYGREFVRLLREAPEPDGKNEID